LGAGDGVLYSNTKFFEDTLGWRGVLIEPVPEQFGRLKKNRPLAGSFKIAICRGNTDSTMVDMVGTGPTAGMLRTMDPGFKQDWHAGDTNFYKVHGGPISTVLHLAGIERIDLFSIDVEGAEEEVVQTMDWTIPVHIIVIELDGRNKARDDRITAYLTEKGFTYFNRIGGNCYFENKAFPRIQARTASSD
jgi:FkbM family methyltransferase